MEIYNCMPFYSFPSSNIKQGCAIINPKRRGLGSAACSRKCNDQSWNHGFSEKSWVEYQKKVGEIKEELLESRMSLSSVDAIQRLGLDHLFDDEIDIILTRQYDATNNFASLDFDDLYDVSLSFRLLRNQGFYVSADVFNGFKGKDGKFKEKLKQDVRGLMELYEAAQLGFRDEDIIDEAKEFSRVNLKKCLKNVNVGDWHKKIVKNTLRHPQHKNIARLTVRRYIDGGFVKGCEKGWGKELIELAKMDVSMGELLHQEELLHISKWWQNVGIAKELERARSQPVKWYIWSMAMLINNPSLSFARIELTKVIAFVYLIDDIFDLYGDINELTLFTQAIYTWEYDAANTLPKYMRKTYTSLLNTTYAIAQLVEGKYNTNPIHSLKAVWGSLCSAFMVEARWFSSKSMPNANEYLKNGEVSSGVHVVLLHLFYLLGLSSSIDSNQPSTLVSSIATMLRLYDDLGSAEDEHQDGSDGSYIKYCMNEEPNLSIEGARLRVEKLISNQWKILNEECFRERHMNHSSISCFRRACLNFARMVPLMYTYDDNQRLLLLEEQINTNKLYN